MRVTDKRLSEVIDFYNNNGEDRTVEELGLTHESVHRYIREYRIRKRGLNKQEKRKELPNVLIYDLEVAPLSGWVFRVWKENISPKQLETEWFILTWSAKWLMDDKIYSDRLTSEEALNQDDKRITGSLWELINQADVVIAHNGKKYDIPKMNTKFLLHGLPRPLPYQVIDTLDVSKRQFAFTYNKLDYICKILGLGGKIETGGMEFWRAATKGDDDTLEEMEIYNKRDVTLLEEAYLKIRSWIPSHPNLSLYVETTEPTCPVCLNTDLSWEGYYSTMVGRYNTFRCKECGSVGRVRQSGLSKEHKKNLMASIAR